LAEIKRRGSNLTQLAIDAGLQASACRTALVRAFPAADQVIADYLDVPLHELWPDRYREDGSRIDRRTIRFREQNNRRVSQTHGQNARAA
jgi:Ner family transcriptional regulator